MLCALLQVVVAQLSSSLCAKLREKDIFSNEHGFVWQSDIFPDGFSVLVKVLMQRSTQLTRK